jgi:hypothetical protein
MKNSEKKEKIYFMLLGLSRSLAIIFQNNQKILIYPPKLHMKPFLSKAIGKK